jgi:hypothetical protein
MRLQGFVLSRQEILSKLQSLLTSLRIRGQGNGCIPQLRIEAIPPSLGEERLKGFPNQLGTRLSGAGGFLSELLVKVIRQPDADDGHARTNVVQNVIHTVHSSDMGLTPKRDAWKTGDWPSV